MKKLITTYSFLFSVFFVVAQKQVNTWYFGNKVGLDFNQLPPRPLNNSAIGSVEGCSVISDNNGKMLFYTNGLRVMNRKHLQMKNGDKLMGDLSSTNNALIIPLPDNDSIYYLFTVGAQNQTDKGFRYNIINMRGDSGYGEIIQKNIFIEDQAFEKLAGVKHCNKKDVWITIRKWNSDEYHSYLVTSAGIDPVPVISHTGFIPGNPIGTLKFSADGKKLAAVYSFETDTIEVMHFDNTSGLITNPVTFRPNIIIVTDELYIQAYGAEFSPNGNLLYISANISSTEPSTLYQFDVSSNTAAAMLGSKQIIAQNSPWSAGALQIGPDKKIYMAMGNDTSLSVIENPDVYGTGCNFMYNKIFLGQEHFTPVQPGLPNFIQSYFDPGSNPYDFTRSGNCADQTVSFSISRLTGIDSVKWDFGDGQKSQLLSPVNHYANPGYYDVNLIVYKVDCSGLNDTITRKIWVANSADFLGKDTGSCSIPSLQLGIDDITNANYLWNTGEISNKIITSDFGLYWLQIEQNGCSITDSINVIVKPKPVANIGRDTSVCLYKSIVLSAGNLSASAYLWNTGATTPTITLNTPGTYSVAVTGNSCVASDTAIVSWGDCEVFLPTAFTPDHNGHNDQFGVAGGFAFIDFYMQIFDRWGNPVFISGNPDQKWDGTSRGKAVPNGTYAWILSYTNIRGHKNFLRGSVLLIR